MTRVDCTSASVVEWDRISSAEAELFLDTGDAFAGERDQVEPGGRHELVFDATLAADVSEPIEAVGEHLGRVEPRRSKGGEQRHGVELAPVGRVRRLGGSSPNPRGGPMTATGRTGGGLRRCGAKC